MITSQRDGAGLIAVACAAMAPPLAPINVTGIRNGSVANTGV
ncbi:hypothetical protein [Acetobacter sacchari]|nr:hypothetical protein [Acetobacter sacchari]